MPRHRNECVHGGTYRRMYNLTAALSLLTPGQLGFAFLTPILFPLIRSAKPEVTIFMGGVL